MDVFDSENSRRRFLVQDIKLKIIFPITTSKKLSKLKKPTILLSSIRNYLGQTAALLPQHTQIKRGKQVDTENHSSSEQKPLEETSPGTRYRQENLSCN